MKNRITLLLVGALTHGTVAFGDIQSSPGSHWNWSRKLSRALGNLAYGWAEYPIHWQKVERSEGVNAAGTSAVVEGTTRSVVRIGYGLYEFVTFPFPSYKGGYRPPYFKKERFDPWFGYEEFPPQVGFTSQARYSRTQSW
ncbi:MAG: exosortase system-associated protein, TIGR04073 family [Roseimicrobium sp.]